MKKLGFIVEMKDCKDAADLRRWVDLAQQQGIDGVEQALRARLGDREDATVSLHCDKTVAVDEVVKVMNVARDNGYKLILATSPN